jgi:hypothetical protein
MMHTRHGHRYPSLTQRLIQRGRVALVGALQRDRHHRARVQIDRVFGLVGQVRALIVVGSHGQRGIRRFLLGSVADFVARHATCSVEIVRTP